MRNRRLHSKISLLLFFCGCAVHTPLQSVDTGKVEGYLSVGGPIVSAFGTKPPIPYLYAGANYGWKERMDVNVGLHLLPIFYEVAGIDLGFTWFPLLNQGWKPTLGLQAMLINVGSFKRGVEDRYRAYPVLTASGAWKAGRGLFYSGAHLGAPLTRPDYDSDAAPVIFSPFIGYRWKKGPRWSLTGEIKWQGANVENPGHMGYIDIGGYGALTPLVAVGRGF